MNRLSYILMLMSIWISPWTLANTSIESCVLALYKSGNQNMTLAEVKAQCDPTEINRIGLPKSGDVDLPESRGAITERILKESRTEFDSFVITPHKMNYFLPIVSTNAINKEAYSSANGYEENLEDIEAKFQLSLKVPLNNKPLFTYGDGLYLGFTTQAWWQVYSSNISKPFRESNYQPEIFYLSPLPWHPFGGNTGFVLGFEHQSNGKAQNLSRSWNRIYSHFLFEKGDFALSFRPWYRIEEDEKAFEFDPDGDDNPDIADYMGHFELGLIYRYDHYQFSLQGRQNFSTHKGAVEFGMTFPLWGKLRGYANAFSGYGESLIDYNHNQTRIGIGISLNDLL